MNSYKKESDLLNAGEVKGGSSTHERHQHMPRQTFPGLGQEQGGACCAEGMLHGRSHSDPKSTLGLSGSPN